MKKLDVLLEHVHEQEQASASSGSSPAELELLKILQCPAKHPATLELVKSDLLASFSEFTIQKAIIHLLEEGLIETVYTPGVGLSFILAPL